MGGADQGQRDLSGLKRPAMPIKLAENFRAVFYAPFYATALLGLYEKHGVEVELIASSHAGEGVSALLSGKVDAAWGGPMRLMKAHDADPDSPLRCLGEVVARDPFYLVAAKHCRAAALEDLRSVKLAVVSEVPTPWLCLQHDLRERGIDPSRLDRATEQTMAANLKDLSEARLDVAQLFEPYVSIAVQSGAGHILYAASTRGPTVYTTLISTRDALGRHREAFTRMLGAIREMQEWLSQHSAEELAQITAPHFPDIARDILVNSLARYRQGGIWAPTPGVSREGFTRLGECLRSGGFVSRPPVYEECVDQTLSV
jgi:NitT/TauT family transport system substrate-binding protein